MSHIQVQIQKGEDGKADAVIGIALTISGRFHGGNVEKLGHKECGKKFVDGLSKMLIKDIRPQIQDALKREWGFYLNPETRPAPPENMGAPTTEEKADDSERAHADHSEAPDGGVGDGPPIGDENRGEGIPYRADVPLIEGPGSGPTAEDAGPADS